MKKFCLLLLILSGGLVYGQSPLQIQIAISPALCRIASFQNGNGVITASVSGGTPGYSYSCLNLQNGNTFGNGPVWQSLNPGQYQITVTDMANNVVVDTVTLDSINPIADFDAVSIQLSQVPGGYVGIDSANVQFENTSLDFSTEYLPADTVFYWNLDMTNPSGWFFSFDYNEVFNVTYYPGTYQIGLIAMNPNGCQDTTVKTITISSPANLAADISEQNVYTLIPHYGNKQIKFEKVGFKYGLELKIYTVSGQLILSMDILDSEVDIPFSLPHGIYIYEVINKETNSTAAGNNKFIF